MADAGYDEKIAPDAPESWNAASYVNKIDPNCGLQVAPWFDRRMIFRKVRRSMTNEEYIALCGSHEPRR